MQNENSGGIKNWSQTTVQTGRSTSDRGDSTDAGDDDSEKTTPRTTGGDRTGGCTPIVILRSFCTLHRILRCKSLGCNRIR